MKAILKNMLCLLAIAGLFTGCGRHLDGLYVADVAASSSRAPDWAMEFKGDTVICSIPDRKITYRYRIDGDTIRFEPVGAEGPLAQKFSARLQPDGSVALANQVFRKQ